MLMWWRSAVNFSFFLCLAACRMRASACDTVPRLCARPVLCWIAFPSASALGSTGSAADRSALFVGFPATTAELTPHLRASSATAPRLPDADQTGNVPVVGRGVSRFPRKERPHMPVSTTTPGRLGARAIAPIRFAFRQRNNVGTRDEGTFAAQWLACALPCQRFAVALASNRA